MVRRTNSSRPRLEQPCCGRNLEEKFPATDQSLVSRTLSEHSLARLWAISPCNFLDYACCHSENNVCKLRVQGGCLGRSRILCLYCVHIHKTTKFSILPVNLQNNTVFKNNGFQYF